MDHRARAGMVGNESAVVLRAGDHHLQAFARLWLLVDGVIVHDGENLCDVRMTERRDQFCLAMESCASVGVVSNQRVWSSRTISLVVSCLPIINVEPSRVHVTPRMRGPAGNSNNFL